MRFVLCLLAGVLATELTPANWDAATTDKNVFIKFLAPWCGHCKKMKPDWDKLMAEFDGHASTLVGDVDCTTEGKSICETAGVKGYPTIKYGDPSNMETYEGGRDFESLQTFARGLKPSCSPARIELCDEEDAARILELQALDPADLAQTIKDEEKKIKKAEKVFEKRVEKLQAKYQEFQTEKDDAIAAVKAAGLGLMKSVKAAAGKAEL